MTVIRRAIRNVALSGLVLTAASCSSIARRLEYSSLDSPALGRQMNYAVYTPPDFSANEQLPLVVFLHGRGDDETCFDRAGVGQTIDLALARGAAPRCVVVVPDGELGFWENWQDGSQRYRDWVMRDLLPEVRKRFHTSTAREHTHVMGISMGGHGTLRFARLERETFSSAAAISAPVMDAEHLMTFCNGFWVRMSIPVARIWGPTDDIETLRKQDLFTLWQRQEDLRDVRVLTCYGTSDFPDIVTGNRNFHEHLRERGIDHGYHVYYGRHRWIDWRPLFPEILQWLVDGPKARRQ